MFLNESWQELLDEHWKIIEEGNVEVIKAETSSQRTLSLVFKLAPDLSARIKKDLDRVIPENLKRKIIFQPPEGYHLTLFWSARDNLEGLDVPKFTQTLSQLFSETPVIVGTVSFPYFGKAGLLSIFTTEMEEEILFLRKKVEQIFLSFGASPGFKKENFDLIWGSLTRYSAGFTLEEKPILKNLTAIEVPDVTFNEAILVLNDKFLTSENTEVLGHFGLKGL